MTTEAVVSLIRPALAGIPVRKHRSLARTYGNQPRPRMTAERRSGWEHDWIDWNHHR